MSFKGKYTPKNISKYRGNWQNIIHRSGWERSVMKYLDENASVIEWASEEHVIPYVSPLDGKYHRYFVDFWIKVQKPDGTIKEYLWEVKPHSSSIPPVLKEDSTPSQKRKYAMAVKTYAVNEAKWKAAREICQRKGWTFHVVTEKQLSVFTDYGKKKRGK